MLPSKIKWVLIPVGLGAGYIIFDYWRVKELNELGIYPNCIWNSWITIYRSVPLRTMSRLWGWINDFTLPVSWRKPILEKYSHTFNCNMDEAVEKDYQNYRSLGEFFRRQLKSEARPVSNDLLVCPSDGRILHIGPVDSFDSEPLVEQVKGYSYKISAFIGRDMADDLLNDRSNKNRKLYQCTIYLSPGDYHHFHSPADWTVKLRRHFTGDLLSVAPSLVRRIPWLFAVNERVLLVGEWKHGKFFMAPVAATNVGNIKLNFDTELNTNTIGLKRYRMLDHSYENQHICPKKGQELGEFRLGSSIVLIFEAPSNFNFAVKEGDTVKYGQTLGRLQNSWW